jgi:hypothetical protein
MLSLLFLMAISLQVIQVNETAPCFLNYSAGLDMLRNCGLGNDYLETSLLGWEWITGGYFSMILVGLFTMISYVKYHKAIYPLTIGTLFLPISYFLFPSQFINFAILFAGVTIGLLVLYVLIKQTKEY